MCSAHSVVGSSLIAALCLAASCSSSSNDTPAQDGGGTDAPPAVAAGLSCMQILACVADCPEGDLACGQRCADSGTPEGFATVETLARCIEEQACPDAACVQTRCAAQLEACVAESRPQTSGAPLDGPPPAGSVPAELVGSWAETSWGTTYRLVLAAAGTGTWEIASSATTGCVTIASSTETGTVVVDATTITLYATEVINLKKVCSAPSERSEGTPVQERFAWQLRAPTTLELRDLRCIESYAGDPASAETYCTHALTRE